MGTYHKDGGYSADVEMYIVVAKLFKIDVAAILVDEVTLRDPPALPPCNAMLYIIVDGSMTVKIIRLPEGTSPNKNDYRITYRLPGIVY